MSDDDIVEISKPPPPPKYGGVFSALNNIYSAKSYTESVIFTPLNSLSPSILKVITEDQPCMFISHIASSESIIFGPYLVPEQTENWYQTFNLTNEQRLLISNGARALVSCVTKSENPVFFWPYKINFSLNGKLFDAPNPSATQGSTQFWLDVTDSLSDSNVIVINLSDVKSATPYYFVIQLYNIAQNEDILEELMKRKHFDFNDWKKINNEIMENSDDINETSYNISLLCPLGYSRIVCPVRGVNCNHLSCFDAMNYLILQRSTADWICPRCGKKAPLDELRVDDFNLTALKHFGNDVETIIISRDGTAKPLKTKLYGGHDSDSD